MKKMIEKKFNEKLFMGLLRNPSTLDSEIIQLDIEMITPKKEKE